MTVLLAGAVPMLLARPAPLQDWPNHLARVEIVDALLRGDPFWQRFYQLGTFLVPNAALDLGVLGLHRMGLGVPAAGQVFLVATYAVFVAGCCALARALGAWGAEKPALAVLLFYGNALFWGLVNYVLSVGLMLALLAAWLDVRSPKVRLAVALAGTPVLLCVHVVPAVAFALVAGCFDLVALVRRAAPWWACLSGTTALLLVAALLRLLPGGTGHDLGLAYAGGGSAAGFVAWKARVLATALLGGSSWQDGATLFAVLVAAAAYGLAARPRLVRPEAGLALAALVLLVLAAPERIGTGSLLDVRLAVLPLLWVAAAMRPVWRGPGARRLAVVALAAVVGVRTLAIGQAWWAASDVFEGYASAAKALPPGGLMMMAYGTPLATLSWAQVWSPPITSIATQVVSRGLLFPAIFANPAQQPVFLRHSYAALAQPWDLTGPLALDVAAARLRPLCASGAYTGVFLTALYPGRFDAGAALLHADPSFLLLDACRLASR